MKLPVHMRRRTERPFGLLKRHMYVLSGSDIRKAGIHIRND